MGYARSDGEAPAPPPPGDRIEDPNSIKAIVAANIPKSVEDVFPIVDVMRELTSDDIKSDIVAGLTVAVMVVPQGMAYAALASLTPEIGLYSCIIPILTYAILGTSRQLAVGPVAMVALLTAAGLSPLQDPAEDPVRYQQLASTLAFLVGVFQAGMGFFRLEFIARFLPHPVLSGFTSAAAIVIGSSQLKDVFRLNLERSEKLHEILGSFFREAGHSHSLTMVVAFTSIIALVLTRYAKKRHRSLKRLPEALFLVVFWILVSHYDDFAGKGVKVIGKVPSGFPSPGGILWGEIGSLVGPALSISLVGFLESFAVAKTIAEKEGYQMSARRELIGLGLCNVAGAFFKCMPVTGGFSRSAVNYQAGAKSTFASIVTAIGLIVTVLVLTPLFTDLPKPILSAIIIVAVSTLVDFGEFAHLWATDKRDFLLVLCAFLCTLFWGLLEGILVSAALAIAMLVQRVADPHSAVLVKVSDDPPVFRNRERFPDGEPVPGTLIYRMDAPLFYANADSFKDDITVLGEGSRVIIIHGGPTPHVDSSGVAVLAQLRRRCVARGKRLLMCECNGPVRDALRNAGITYDADADTDADGKKTGHGKSEEEAPTPMFLALNDAVAHARAFIAAAAMEDVAVDLGDEAADRDAAAFGTDARTVVSANDL